MLRDPFTWESMFGSDPVQMTDHVLSFAWPHDRKHLYLSNLYEDPVTIDGKVYRCAEAAYQASKTNNPDIKDRFTGVDGRVAYALSRRLGLYHQNLEGENLDALLGMFKVLSAKFTQLHSASREYLRTTGDAFLLAIESDYTQYGLTWATRSNGTGLNMIGFMLMYIRELNAMEFEDRNIDFPWYRWFSRHSDDGIYKSNLDQDNAWRHFVICACSAVRDRETSTCAMAGCGRPSFPPHRYCSRTCARAYHILQ